MERFYSKVNTIVRAKYVRELRASRAAEEAEVDEAPGDGVLLVVDLPEIPKRDTPKREEESTHEITLSGDVNELVEEMDGLEVVDDDDINSEDEFDGDD